MHSAQLHEIAAADSYLCDRPTLAAKAVARFQRLAGQAKRAGQAHYLGTIGATLVRIDF